MLASHSFLDCVRSCTVIAIGVGLTVWLVMPTPASAHAHLIQGDPAPGNVIAHSPAVAEFLFDEPLNPTLTRVRIMTATGLPVTTATGGLVAGHHDYLWQLPIPQLAAGMYSVYWTSESATDGHVMSSFYTFRVDPAGTASRFGAVSGESAGAYGVSGAAGSGVALDSSAFVTLLIHWIVLMAQALWLGSIIVGIVVIGRGQAGQAPERQLATAAAPRVRSLGLAALALTLIALLGEIVSLSVQGTGGEWGRALLPGTLGGILGSQSGHYTVVRLVLLMGAVALTVIGSHFRKFSADSVPRFPARIDISLLLLALTYMAMVALSGHAADVTPGLLSYPIDWLHLVCTAAWVGGIATLAYGIMPARRALAPENRATAVLQLLDRFSPVAYASVGLLILSGLYNALNHIAAPSVLLDALYGQVLLVKIALVGLLIGLGATHVFYLRPRIAVHNRRPDDNEGHAVIHEGLGALAGRLRVESGVGAAILLATAVMSQTLPAQSVSGVPMDVSGNPQATITGTASLGDLSATLSVAPPQVGTSTFTLALKQRGKVLTGDTAAAIIHLISVSQPIMQAVLNPVAHGPRFVAHGSLAEIGTWRADILIRTPSMADYRTLSLSFIVGPGAAFLAPGLNAARVTIGVVPGLISAPNTFVMSGIYARAVRLLSQSLDMNMGVLTYPAVTIGRGRWQVRNLFAPMNGRWALTVQSDTASGWVTLRQFVYAVPLKGAMRLLQPQGRLEPTPISGVRSLRGPYNIAFVRTLPYTALVTDMGSDGVRQVGKPLLATGLQAHGVDILDGTPYAYITNFGAIPGTVTQIDTRSMHVVRTFTVGIGPAHIIFTPDHRQAFVTNFRSNDLSVIDLRKGVVTPIEFPNGDCFQPHGIDIAENGQTLYVACAGGAWIATVDVQSERPGQVVVTAPGTFGIAVDGPRHEVWATNQTVNTVSVVDEHSRSVVATIPVGKGPALLVASPDGRRVYVADQLGNTVSVIDAARRRIIATIPVAAQPHGPDVTPDGKYVYVASIGGNAVTIIRVSDNQIVGIVPSAVGANEVAIAH